MSTMELDPEFLASCGFVVGDASTHDLADDSETQRRASAALDNFVEDTPPDANVPAMPPLPLPDPDTLLSDPDSLMGGESAVIHAIDQLTRQSDLRISQKGDVKISNDVPCYDAMWRPDGCGGRARCRSAVSRTRYFYACDACHRQFNMTPPHLLAPGEDPRVQVSHRNMSGTSKRAGGYGCKTCGLKKNRAIAMELGMPHCVCKSPEASALPMPSQHVQGPQDSELDDDIGGIYAANGAIAPAVDEAAATATASAPPGEHEARLAAAEAMSMVQQLRQTCSLRGGGQFAAVDALQAHIAKPMKKRSLVHASLLSDPVPVAPPPAKKSRMRISQASDGNAPSLTTSVPVQLEPAPAASAVAPAAGAVAPAAGAVTPAVAPEKRVTFSVPDDAPVRSSIKCATKPKRRLRDRSPPVVAPVADDSDKGSDESDLSEEEEEEDVFCYKCATPLDSEGHAIKWSIGCSRRKCCNWACYRCGGFKSVAAGKRFSEKSDWFCNLHCK